MAYTFTHRAITAISRSAGYSWTGYEKLAIAALAKFSDDQPRDEQGRWTAGANPASGKRFRPKPTKERAWNGEPVATAYRISKADTGRLAEAMIRHHLYVTEGYAQPAASAVGFKGSGSKALDVFADHMPVEVKGGLVSNGTTAMQWRITEGGKQSEGVENYRDRLRAAAQKGGPKGEKAAATLKAFNKAYIEGRLREKYTMVRQMEKARGLKAGSLKPTTFCVIVNPETRHADVYRFKGYHTSIAWRSPMAAKGFVQSYKY